MAAKGPRAGRGRLSSIDLLPDWAEPAVVAALAKLRDNNLPQIEIHEQFNAELRALAFAAGVADPPQISASAFNRKTMRLAAHGRRLAEAREIATALASKFEQGGDEDLTLLTAETIKTIVFEMLENAGRLSAAPASAEMMANFALALKSAEQAKKVTADTRIVIEKNFRKQAEGAIDKVGKERGLSAETVAGIKASILNLKPAAPAQPA
jgi:hypothetical protein